MERQLRLPQLGMKIRGAEGWGKVNSVNRRGNRKGQPSPAKRRNEAATKFQFQLFIYIFIFYFFRQLFMRKGAKRGICLDFS